MGGEWDGHALIYLTKDNYSWEACVWIIWNSWMKDEDAYKMGFLKNQYFNNIIIIIMIIKKHKDPLHVYFLPPLKVI